MPANAIPSTVTKAVLVGSDPKGVNTSTGTVITIAENQAGIYEPIGRDATAKPGDAAPDPATLITNKDDLPDGTTYTWEATPDLSNEGDVPATIVVTYPDNSTDKVTINIAVTENATQAQTYSARGGSVEKGYGETATLDELAATVTYDPALAEGLNPTIALADGASIPTEGKNNDVALVVTYPDGSKDNVTVTVSYQSAAEKYAATGSSIVKGYGETLTADELARAVTVTPDDSAVKSIAPADPDNLPTEGAVNMVPMVVTYNDGTTDTVNVAVAFGTAADKYTASAKEVIRKPIDGEVTLDDLKNNVVYSPALANADDVSDVKLADGQTLPTEGVNAVDVVVTYKDGSTDTVPMRVVFGTAAERNDPQGQNINAVMGEDAPAASTAISNAAALQDVSEIVWKETPDTSTAGEQGATVLVKYIDGTEDEVPVKVNVIDSRADSVKYDAQGGSMTKPYGQTATLDELKAQVAFNGDAPADGTYSVALADGVTIPTSGKDNAVVLVVTYADKTTDTVTVKLSYGDASDAYTPTAQPIAADLGATPAASDGIANKGDLPAGTTYDWKDGSPDTSEAGTKIGTVVVTYPDGTTDEVEVAVKVTSQSDAYTPEYVDVTTPMGTVPNAAAAVSNGSTLPAGTTYAWKTGPDVSKPGTTVTATVVVTYPDGTTDEGEVQITVNDTRADSLKYDAQGGELTKPYGQTATLDELAAKVTFTPEAGRDAVASITLPTSASIPTKGEGNAVTLVVTYKDGTTDVATVTLSYSDAADTYNPTAQPITVDLGTAPAASDGIANKGDLPDGTSYGWKGGTAPDTSQPGTTTGTVVVTYPDGSTDEVPVTVNITDTRTEAQKHTATSEALNVAYGTKVTAADIIAKVTVDPNDAASIALADGVTIPTDGKGLKVPVTVTFSDGSTTSTEVTLSYGDAADAYAPVAKPIEVLVNSTPAAADGIANLSDLPAGTTVTWQDGKAPDTSKVGTTTGTALVTYPDGTTDTVEVAVTVKTAADVYDPIPKDGVTAPTGGNAPDAKDVIENMGDLPEGTKAEWTPTPDTSKPGSTTGTVTITYPDGSTDTVEVPVKVGTDAELYDPVGKDLNVPTGSELPAAADAIENMGDLPSGTTATWADPKPDTSKPGKQTGTVIVTYPDGSTDTVEVSVKVGTDAEAYDPTGKDITTDENGTLPDASDGIANPGDLPDGTTIEWKDPKPDTSKPGDYTGTIVVTYPDGSSEEITVKITVPEKSKDNGQNNGGQGNSDGNGQNTSGAKNTGGKGGRGTKGKLPKTGDASTIATGSLMGGGIIASALGSIIAAWKRRRRDAE